MVKTRGNERGLRKEGGRASAEEKTCAQGSSCEEGPKRPGLRVLQEQTCWENTTPNCCELVLNKGTGSYLSPAALLTVLGTSAACQGERGKIKKPGSLHPRPHQEERVDTPAAGWVTRGRLLGWFQHRRLVHMPVFAVNGDQMCVWQNQSQPSSQVLITLPVPSPRPPLLCSTLGA